MITAKKFLDSCGEGYQDELTKEWMYDYITPKQLRRFAEMHVKAALDKAMDACESSTGMTSVRYPILNAYPLKLIK